MTGPAQPDLSISIVSLNRPDLVRQCLASLARHTRALTYDVHLVAHNWSADTALRELQGAYANLLVHRVSGIRGYSMNNNVALRAARGRYVAILNDDTLFSSAVLGRLVGILEAHPDAAGACPALRNPDGSLQMGFRGRLTPWSLILQQVKLDRMLPNTWARALGAMDRPWLPPSEAAVEIEAGTGACFVARRAALEAIGFLDEAYHLGPDDIDWTQRLRRQVGRVVLLPRVSLTHLAGATMGNSYHRVLPAIFAGYYTFFRRFYGRAADWAVRLSLGCIWSAALAAGWGLSGIISRSPRAVMLRRARWGCVRDAVSTLPITEGFAPLA